MNNVKPHHVLIDIFHEGRMEARMYKTSKIPNHYLSYTEPGKNTVVIIPGIGHKWSALKHLADFISLKGHPVYVVEDLGFNYKEIPTSAKIVKDFIERNKLDNVILVAHSKGGLIGKYILANENKNGKVIGLVSLSTPYSGTHLAKFLIFKHWTVFSPKSSVIRELMENKKVNNRIISIYPKSDTVVWHTDKSFLNGAFKNIEVNSHGHVRLTFDKKVQELVEKSIEELG